MKMLPAKLHEPDWPELTEAEIGATAERVEALLDRLHSNAGYIVQAIIRDDGEVCLLVSEATE